MNLGEKNSHLVKVAAIINVMFFLLCIALISYLGPDHFEAHQYLKKITGFAMANIICWVINVCIVIFLLPKISRDKQKRGVSFYFSGVITF